MAPLFERRERFSRYSNFDLNFEEKSLNDILSSSLLLVFDRNFNYKKFMYHLSVGDERLEEFSK